MSPQAQRQELSNQTAEASAYIDQLTRINDSITHLNVCIYIFSFSSLYAKDSR